MIDRQRKERDELRRTKDRLRSERSTAHEVCDRTIRECDEAHWEVEARRADLGVEVARRLDAEGVSAGLRTDLADARGLLQVESDKYGRLSSTVLAVCDGLQVA